MKRLMAVALSLALVSSVMVGQDQSSATTTTTTTKKAAPRRTGSVSDQLNQLKEAIEAQQLQIKQLNDRVEARDEKIQLLEQQLNQNLTAAQQAQAKADAAAAQAAAAESQGQQTVVALKSDVADLKANSTSTAMSLQETQKRVGDLESPLAIHYKGITITPGGFLAAETVYRNRALGADINTPFNSINYPGAGQNNVSEFFGSGRQSRITMLAEGKAGSIKMSGYYEADFLSAGVTSNNNESNSYTLRQRQVWGQAAADNGWTFTGGQMWSLITETRKGTDNRTEALPMTIDPQYTVGFSWARQYGVRLSKNFNNTFWLAASLEDPQTTFSETNAAANFAFGAPGTSSGLYNGGATAVSAAALANYSFNAMPDIIVKAAAQPSFGHFEVYGIFTRFRDRVYPCAEVSPTVNPQCGTVASAIGAANESTNGGGLGANARVSVMHKHVDFGLHGLFGNGIGRYGTAGLPDATVNPDGTLGKLRSYQGLATLEFHYPKIDVYFNGGEEYVARRYSLDPISGKTVGYGAPSFNDSNCYSETLPGSGGYSFGAITCSGNTQNIVEGTFGFWIKLLNGPKGRLQFGPQYSYVSRNAWAGQSVAATMTTPAEFVSPHGIDNMFMTSFRYYLP